MLYITLFIALGVLDNNDQSIMVALLSNFTRGSLDAKVSMVEATPDGITILPPGKSLQ